MPIQFSVPDNDIEIQGTRFPKNEVLMFKDVPLLKVEANKNRDVISEQNAKDIAATIALKPISLEHRPGRMAGIFTEGRFESPYVLTSGLVYTKHVPAEDIAELTEGKKSLSIEAGAEKAICSVCNQSFDKSADYCNHLQAKVIYDAYRHLDGAYATGGGIVKNPAGSNTAILADAVKFIASVDDVGGRDFSADERKTLAKDGKALPDGSFPIVNEEDLHNAIRAIGRASDPDKAKAHIIARAKAMGMESALPEDWIKGKEEPASNTNDNKNTSDCEDKEESDKMNHDMEEVKAKLKEALDKNQEHEKAVPQMQARIDELVTLNAKLLEENRHMLLVERGVLTEDEWAAKKDTILKMDKDGVELLASLKPKQKITLSQTTTRTVTSEQTPKPILVIG